MSAKPNPMDDIIHPTTPSNDAPVAPEEAPIAQELQLVEQVAQLTDALQRERADSVNLRRRTDEERSKYATLYKVHVLKDLLPFLDNISRAMTQVPEDLGKHTYIQGIMSVNKQLETALTKIGVTKIPTLGETFDPNLHEAVSVEDNGGEVEVVTAELQSGYTLDGEVIRHAMVKVTR
jgi:molecular chaperone GrpE